MFWPNCLNAFNAIPPTVDCMHENMNFEKVAKVKIGIIDPVTPLWKIAAIFEFD
jgi:hypothetical protein